MATPEDRQFLQEFMDVQNKAAALQLSVHVTDIGFTVTKLGECISDLIFDLYQINSWLDGYAQGLRATGGTTDGNT